MKMKFRAAVGSILVTAVAAGAAVVPAASSAGDVGIMASPGQVCNVYANYYPVYGNLTYIPGSFLYYLNPGDGVRILGYAGDYYRGRGNGKPEGYFHRSAVNQSSCHWP